MDGESVPEDVQLCIRSLEKKLVFLKHARMTTVRQTYRRFTHTILKSKGSVKKVRLIEELYFFLLK